MRVIRLVVDSFYNCAASSFAAVLGIRVRHSAGLSIPRPERLKGTRPLRLGSAMQQSLPDEVDALLRDAAGFSGRIANIVRRWDWINRSAIQTHLTRAQWLADPPGQHRR